MDDQPIRRQRSPWFYVLLGCGGLAGLLCLGLGGSGLYCAKQVKDISQGMTDPKERQRNAVDQLGAVPEGYSVVASVSLFGMKQTVLTDQALLPDGGAPLGGRQFSYQRVIASEGHRNIKAFLDGSDPDGAHLAEGPVRFDLRFEPGAILKRGQLVLDGRKLDYLVVRLAAPGGREASEQPFASVVYFECPDDALRMGYWTQSDPAPGHKPAAAELAGTVADEGELARFLKPMNPCGR
jgi:hypothetical protein